MMKSIVTLISLVLCSFSTWAQTITAAQDPWPPFEMDNPQQKTGFRWILSPQHLRHKVTRWSSLSCLGHEH